MSERGRKAVQGPGRWDEGVRVNVVVEACGVHIPELLMPERPIYRGVETPPEHHPFHCWVEKVSRTETTF